MTDGNVDPHIGANTNTSKDLINFEGRRGRGNEGRVAGRSGRAGGVSELGGRLSNPLQPEDQPYRRGTDPTDQVALYIHIYIYIYIYT